ncbi:MAG: hypothetical protein ACI8QZ_003437 [Chlamydiales bacterium]|jgi:hypothetical protein
MLSLLLALSGALQVDFDAHFTGRSLRFDYSHTGTADEEHIALDRFRLEGQWSGSRVHLIDDTNLGKYLFCVVDPRTNRTLYSRGFSSIYGEWETTAEARDRWGIFHESQRLPEPKRPVQVLLKKRGPDGSFQEFYSTVVDPQNRFVDRSEVAGLGETWKWQYAGPPATKVDLLIVAEGYTADQKDKFQADVDRLASTLFETEPFKERRTDFNVRLLFVPAAAAGISNPRAGIWRDSPFGLSFNAFDSDRYVLTYDNQTLREAAAQVPYDALILMFNDRKYGGGGIYNLWSTCAADSKPAPYLIVHEFGHSFAGLADEYYTSQVSYEGFTAAGTEPWEPNATALLDPERLKWRDLVADGTPIPTPWSQAAYDDASYAYQKKRTKLRADGASEADMEALFDEVKAITKPMLENEKHASEVGAFEGAGYQAKGLYRPEADCIMFTRNPKDFCRVCSRAIERVIDLYAE